jgi:hypothetical protein
MSLDRLLRQPITNVRAFDELPVDAAVWQEAHDYHRHHRQLHALAAHRPGILSGLEVVTSRRRETGVVIAPGIAVDSEGRTIVLREPVVFTITEPRQVYLLLRYNAGIDRHSEVAVGSGVDYFREIEGRDVIQTDQLPRPGQLELARIFRSGADRPILDAADPVRPRRDEISMLHRCPVFPICHADLGVGELSYVPLEKQDTWYPNRAGVIYLLREAGARGFHLWFTGAVNLHSPVPPRHPGLLYMAGKGGFQPLSERDREGLRSFLENGGVLFAETSSSSHAFAESFRELSRQMKWHLKPVESGHPLLTAHHVFATSPTGSRLSGGVEADVPQGVIFSSSDFGAAWQGELEESREPHAPERLQSAIGFGLNVVAFAAHRARRFELSRLE